MKGKLSIKRINKDIKEIEKYPIDGIGIISLNNDIMKYIVNIRIMSGIYEGYCIQLLLTFNDNYPIRPPKILIYPGQLFDGSYHHHIFIDETVDENGLHFYKLCFDLLDNDFLSPKVEHSGWNPSYTISSLLIQVQNFFADPDMREDHLPSKEKISQLMKSMDDYKRTFIIKDKEKEISIIHEWKKPYPEIYLKQKKEQKIEPLLDYLQKELVIKENLKCFISKINYLDDKILLGYPVKKISDDRFIPIPEILSYDCYIEECYKVEEDNDYNNFFQSDMEFIFFDIRNRNHLLKSANNEYYSNWLPIYINDEHFNKHKIAILNSFSILKYGNQGISLYDFQPEHIFEFLPNLLYEMISGMHKNKNLVSSSFIQCFWQYALLYEKLKKEYFNCYQNYIQKNLDLENYCNFSTTKLFYLLMILLFDTKSFQNYENLFIKLLERRRNYLCIKKFIEVEEFKMNRPDLFLVDIYNKKLLNKIKKVAAKRKICPFNKKYKTLKWETCLNNLDSYYGIYKSATRMLFSSDNFKFLILKLLNSQPLAITMKDIIYTFINSNKLIRILLKMDFSQYFDLNGCDYIKHLSFQLTQKNYKKMIQLIYLFEKKFKNINFMKYLMNNYGLFLDNQNFIQLLNSTINDTNLEQDNYILVKQSFMITQLLNDILFLESMDTDNFHNQQKTDEKIYIKQLSKSRDENSIILRKFCIMAKKNKYVLNYTSHNACRNTVHDPRDSEKIMNENKIKSFKKEKLKRKDLNFPKNIKYKNGFKKNHR